jgi:hypothetical protein
MVNSAPAFAVRTDRHFSVPQHINKLMNDNSRPSRQQKRGAEPARALSQRDFGRTNRRGEKCGLTLNDGNRNIVSHHEDKKARGFLSRGLW